jgi:hypothetical protein
MVSGWQDVTYLSILLNQVLQEMVYITGESKSRSGTPKNPVEWSELKG